MKLQIHLSILLVTFFSALCAQAPQGLQYQAVIRDVNGNPVLNSPASFRFTIENEGGSEIYYQETQTTSSNALGGIILVIGAGNTTQGNFESVDWKSGAVKVRVELDATGGQNFTAFGTTSFKSVPYAFFAQQAHSLVDENGNEWVPEDDLDEQTLTVNGNQLSISNGNAVILPTGSGGGDNWGDQFVETNSTLSGDGTLTAPLRIAQQGATNGDALKWNGSSWVPQADANTTYSAGNGISINGTTITNTGDADNSTTNEIQTLSINGNTLSLTNGGSVNLPGVNYTEGTGIDITGSTISALNTTALWNANQLMDFPIAGDDPEVGEYLKYVPPVIGGSAAWRPAPAPTQYWTQNGSNIYYNTGNVGLGVTVPLARLHIANTEKIRMDDQEFGKWASQSFEFSGNIVTDVDGANTLGTITRRWDAVYAVDGTINTSDMRDKTNIKTIQYGLEDILKLRPVSFNWINRPQAGTKLGLIAQELESVIPEVVANPDRTPSLNSEPGAGGETRLGVYYSDLIPVLVKAIQEQQEQINALQAEIEILKNK